MCLTPNIESHLHLIYGPDWRGLEVSRHFCIYSAQGLRKLSHEAVFARIDAFEQPRGARDTGFMIEQSMLIAERSGRTPKRLRVKEQFSRLGTLDRATPRGDFVVLVVQR